MRTTEQEQVFEALESTTAAKQTPFAPATASQQEVRNHRDALVRFLNEIDANLSISELVDILEQY